MIFLFLPSKSLRQGGISPPAQRSTRKDYISQRAKRKNHKKKKDSISQQSQRRTMEKDYISQQALRRTTVALGARSVSDGAVAGRAAEGRTDGREGALRFEWLRARFFGSPEKPPAGDSAMPSGGDQSPPPPPPPPPPVTAASEEEEVDDDANGEAEDGVQPSRSPAPQLQQRFDELCSRLNMDETARAEAWDSYRAMRESYTLEVCPGLVAEGSGVRSPNLPGPPRGTAAPKQNPGSRGAGESSLHTHVPPPPGARPILPAPRASAWGARSERGEAEGGLGGLSVSPSPHIHP